MLHRLKALARDAIPARRQVPVKYLTDRLRGHLEPEMALLPFLVRRGERAIDVGGNRGTYAFALARLGARVEVFEPNPACVRVLGGWAAGRTGVTVHPVALSAGAGTAQLHVPVDARGVEHDSSGSIEASHAAGARDVEVPVRSLDSFGFDDAVLIKIDVEGHESRVIDGASVTLAASRPALLVEIEQRHIAGPIADILAGIEARGYRGFFLADGRLRPVAAFDPARHQTAEAFAAGRGYFNNFLFLDAEALPGSSRYAALKDRWMRG